MSAQREKVLVLGDGTGAFLAVIRSLGRRGIDVHVAWCSSDCTALRSRYVKRYHALPFRDAAGSWIERMTALLDAESFDLVVPTNEQAARALHAQREVFGRSRSRIRFLDDTTFQTVFDKVRSNQLAERVGMRVPRSRLVENTAALEELPAQFGYPLVLKPISSYSGDAPLERRNVGKAYDRAELLQRGSSLLAEGPFVAQENFVGRGVGVELLVDAGQVLFAFQHERVHQPLRGGASSYRRSVPLTPELLTASKEYVGAIGYSGVIMLEFLVNAEEDWRFVEANARFWGSLPLAMAAGADFPYFLYRQCVHGDREFPQNYRTGLYCRDLISDARWFWQNLRADRSDPTLATVSPLATLLELRHMLAGRERFDTVTLDDPLPGVVEPFKYLRRYAVRFVQRMRQRVVSLPPIRRRQSARAIAALTRAQEIVFLCWGNICRSPLAEVYARRAWPAHLRISSRGLHPQELRPSPRDAVAAAQHMGLSLAEHRSRLLSEQEVASADMIVCFDEKIMAELLARHPQARGKAVRFGMLSAGGPASVADPLGQGLDEFCRAYAQIKGTIDASAGAIRGETAALIVPGGPLQEAGPAAR